MTTSMARQSEPARFAVIGYPIAHSLSPRIHAQFAELVGIDLRYELAEVASADFAEFVSSGYKAGFTGFNVTSPHKQSALSLASEKTPRAADAGAANTLTLSDTAIWADNTDGEGLVADLTRQGIELGGSHIALIGAGGAARGVLPAMIEAGVAQVWIANRTLDRAHSLCERFSGRGARLTSHALSALPHGAAVDGIVQATAAGHVGEVPWAGYEPGPDTWCYDLSYGPAAKPFVTWARRQGAAFAVDGLGMLVEQAAAAFEIWHGARPPTEPVLTSLRAALS